MLLPTGLFERHKLLFSFNMTIKIEQAEGRVPQEELDFFLKGNSAPSLPAPSSESRFQSVQWHVLLSPWDPSFRQLPGRLDSEPSTWVPGSDQGKLMLLPRS